MENGLGAIEVSLKTGKEHFKSKGTLLESKLFGFWQWAASDLSGNTMRGILAEYIVASALGVAIKPRIEWNDYDLLTKDGVKLEIKSAAYLQTWAQLERTSISFGIAPTKKWDPSTNKRSGESRRWADVYVFCLLHHKEKSTLNPLDLDQWTFHLLPTSVLDVKLPKQKTIRLGALMRLNPVQASFEQLAASIKKVSSN